MEELVPVFAVAVSGIAAIVVAIIGSLSNRGLRTKIAADLEILEKLEPGTESHTALRDHISARVKEIAGAGEKTRDRFGTAVAIIFVLAGLAMIPLVNSLGGGLWNLLHLLTAFLLIFGIPGFFESFKKTHRDEKGRKIKEQ